MGSKGNIFGYIDKDSPIHRLTGSTKLLMTVIVSIAIMMSYDTRLLIGSILASLVLFYISKIKPSQLKAIFGLVFIFMLFNSIAIFLFSPEEGVKIYGTRKEYFHIIGRYSVTREQLFYQLNVLLKYFSVLPVALIFITTTQPSEFAASLNKIGVSYRISYSVALALRYIPDVQRDFREISQTQQARGVDVSKNVGVFTRLKNSSSILLPLLFSSLDRIDTISNAMELRGFGKEKKRTWYMARDFKAGDYLALGLCILLLILSLYLNYKNGGRFYNPFI